MKRRSVWRPTASRGGIPCHPRKQGTSETRTQDRNNSGPGQTLVMISRSARRSAIVRQRQTYAPDASFTEIFRVSWKLHTSAVCHTTSCEKPMPSPPARSAASRFAACRSSLRSEARWPGPLPRSSRRTAQFRIEAPWDADGSPRRRHDVAALGVHRPRKNDLRDRRMIARASFPSVSLTPRSSNADVHGVSDVGRARAEEARHRLPDPHGRAPGLWFLSYRYLERFKRPDLNGCIQSVHPSVWKEPGARARRLSAVVAFLGRSKSRVPIWRDVFRCRVRLHQTNSAVRFQRTI